MGGRRQPRWWGTPGGQGRGKHMRSLTTGVLISCGLLTGCAQTSAPIEADLPEVYRDAFAQMRTVTKDPEVLAMLADNWISDAEWRNLADRYLDCVAARGLEGELAETEFAYGITSDSQQQLQQGLPNLEEARQHMDQVVDTCLEESNLRVGMLYFELRNNPEGVDFYEAARRCFQREGNLEYANLSDVEIQELLENGQNNQSSRPQPSPLATQQCLTNPSYGDWPAS